MVVVDTPESSEGDSRGRKTSVSGEVANGGGGETREGVSERTKRAVAVVGVSETVRESAGVEGTGNKRACLINALGLYMHIL